MTADRIARDGECVNLKCDRKRWARGLCRKHYEEINARYWRRGESAPKYQPKEKPMQAREDIADKEALWQFVKAQLGIVGNRMETWQKLPK